MAYANQTFVWSLCHGWPSPRSLSRETRDARNLAAPGKGTTRSPTEVSRARGRAAFAAGISRFALPCIGFRRLTFVETSVESFAPTRSARAPPVMDSLPRWMETPAVSARDHRRAASSVLPRRRPDSAAPEVPSIDEPASPGSAGGAAEASPPSYPGVANPPSRIRRASVPKDRRSAGAQIVHNLSPRCGQRLRL
jgi:hypothetical protein